MAPARKDAETRPGSSGSAISGWENVPGISQPGSNFQFVHLEVGVGWEGGGWEFRTPAQLPLKGGGGETVSESPLTETGAANEAGLFLAADSQRTLPVTPPVPSRSREEP